ncbi:MAG: Hsp20/alpha crystallin family protein [Phycisphaerales bacterium]
MLGIFNSPVSLDRVAREFDRAMEQALVGGVQRRAGGAATAWPGVNAWRDGDEIVAEAEIPGFRLEDIEVLATEDALTLRGRRELRGPEGGTALRLERSVREFDRTLRLPIQIDPDGVRASLVNGVLRVSMPVARAARPRRIAIEAAPVVDGAAGARESLPGSGTGPGSGSDAAGGTGA